LKSRGLYDPENIQFSPSEVPPAPPTTLPSPAEIALLTGNAGRGASLVAACYVCHRIGNTGIEYAPTLTGFASRQTTEVVINAIVNPSAEIAQGFDGTTVTLRDDTVIQGLLLSTADPVIVQSMGGMKQLIPASKIKSRMRLNRSLMLSADQLGLKAQDVADIVAYLKTQ
jgi:putative heme-binding domain-containing protein